MIEDTFERALSICVCTSGRPVELARCMKSIREASSLVEVVISCDGGARAACAKIAKEFDATYVELDVPGLCRSRNEVIRRSNGTWLMLLDDDGILGQDALKILAAATKVGDQHSILTGSVKESHGIVGMTRCNYLGFFEAVDSAPWQINLNANLFPRLAFRAACFDESIEYGYEDTDLCFNLLSKGFRIVFVPGLLNSHKPPTGSKRDERQQLRRRARFYVGLRRRLTWEGNLVAAATYAVVAWAHAALREGTFPSSMAVTTKDMSWAIGMAWHKRNLRKDRALPEDDPKNGEAR
jgi:GT2 family glycosyltransferase